jgi:hypothetical protein
MTSGQADGRVFTRIVLVGLVGLAFVGLAVLLTGSNSSLFADQGYAPAAVYAAAAQ